MLFSLFFLLFWCSCSHHLLKIPNLSETLAFQTLANNPHSAIGVNAVVEIAERFRDIRQANLALLIQEYDINGAVFLVEYMHTLLGIHYAVIVKDDNLYWVQSIMTSRKTRHLKLEKDFSTRMKYCSQRLKGMRSDNSSRLSMCSSMYYMTFFSSFQKSKTLYFTENSMLDVSSLVPGESVFIFYSLMELIQTKLNENNVHMGIYTEEDKER